MRVSLSILISLLVGLSMTLAACDRAKSEHHDPSRKDPGSSDLVTSTAIDPITYDALFVVNGDSSSISVINAQSEEVAATIELKNARFPHHINLSPDGTLLAVAIPGADLTEGHSGGHGGGHGEMAKGAILLLDATTGATKVARQLDAMNHNGAFSPAGKEVWTTKMAMPGEVLILDASDLKTLKSIPIGNMPAEVTFSKDGKYAFVANGGSDTVTAIDVSTKADAATIAVGDNPVGAWQGSDNFMYVDNEDGKSISAIDANTLKVIRTYELGFTPAMAVTAPGGELWVTDTENGRVIIYAADSNKKTGEIATGAGAHAITFSKDGKKAYVTNQTAGTVSVIDVASQTVVKDITVGSKPNGLAFRPN